MLHARLAGPFHRERIAVVMCVLALASACSTPNRLDAAPAHGDAQGWGPVASDVERLGWSADGLDLVRERADALGTAAALIVTDGEIVFSYGDIARNYRAHSIRKSLLSALYGIAIDEGVIDPTASLGALGIDDKAPLSEIEKRATVADLLRARSGIVHPAASEVPSMRRNRPARHEHEPGSHWYYNNWDFNALGSIYRQETGDDIFEAFDRRIAAPIGMEDFDLDATRYQLEEVSMHPSYKFRMSARDLARFGVLYLDGGSWDGRQILPRDWIEESTRTWSTTGERGTKSGYGLMWWVVATDHGRPDWPVEPGAFTASGTGGQRVTVLPTIGTVVVHRIDTDVRGGPRIGTSDYDELLGLVVEARLD